MCENLFKVSFSRQAIESEIANLSFAVLITVRVKLAGTSLASHKVSLKVSRLSF